MDICKNCNEQIYPDDEYIVSSLSLFHVECAELLDLEDEED